MRFVCSFAWADHEIQDAEREFIGRLMTALELSKDERTEVDGWLERAPEVDPFEVPLEHKELFLDTARAMIAADGRLDPDEMVNLTLLEHLLG